MQYSPYDKVASGAPRRRNGRQQACEPCRRRKVACDHRLPVCSRCRKGNIAQKCHYLVNGRVLDAVHAPITPASESSEVTTASTTHTPCQPESCTAGARPRLEVYAPRANEGTDTGTGFLGATSFSAVFEEARSRLRTFNDSDLPSDVDQDSATVRVRRTLDQTSSATALSVLLSIPSKRSSWFLQNVTNPNVAWCQLALDRLLDSLWLTFETHLDDEAGRSKLEEMSDILSENTSFPLQENQADPAEWFAAFSGRNFRWESLGMLFTGWAFATKALSEVASTIECRKCFKADRKRLFMQYKDCAWKCIELARDTPGGNTMLLFLIHKHALLETLHTGDASMKVWRLHGESVAMTTFLGLHVPSNSLQGSTTVPNEIKRSMVATIFKIDKKISLFTGRPPLFNRRFWATPLPLDLSDEALMKGDLADGLDENGWNTKGKIYSTTILRARTLLAVIADEVLELALGVNQNPSRDQLLELKSRALAATENFPDAALYDPRDVEDPNCDPAMLYSKILIRLDYLGNLFLIERLLNKQRGTHARCEELLVISYELISLALMFWTHKDHLAGFEADCEWVVMSSAAPAGGILCMELLRNTGDEYGGPNSPIAPSRSDIIQQLSLLIGFFDWVGPSAPNADLCSTTKKVIRRVLDQVLNGAANMGASATRNVRHGLHAKEGVDLAMTGDINNANGYGSIGAELDLNDFFNFELLDTFDWLRPESVSSNF